MASRPYRIEKLLGLMNSISTVPLSLLSMMLTVSKGFSERYKRSKEVTG